MSGAFLSNSPCIFISGKSGIEENDRLRSGGRSEQEACNQMGKNYLYTKRIPEYTANAYKMAVSGRPGPVYLGLPHGLYEERTLEF